VGPWTARPCNDTSDTGTGVAGLTRHAGGNPGGGLGEVTAADFAYLEGVRAAFQQLAAAFTDAGAPLGRSYDETTAGAGQFTADLQPAAVKFLLSWRAVFDVARTDCRLIAGNVHTFEVDLDALDTQLAGQVLL
jgi:hypothetical protein